jgi:hypothetical protein
MRFHRQITEQRKALPEGRENYSAQEGRKAEQNRKGGNSNVIKFDFHVNHNHEGIPMNNDELPIFPVTGWSIATIPAYGALFIQLPFLSHPMQTIEEADPGRRYVFQLQQARDLIVALQQSVQKLENSGFEAMPGETH